MSPGPGARSTTARSCAPLFDGPLLHGGGLDKNSAQTLLTDGDADAAIFGSLYLVNLDLPQRFLKDAPLNTPDRDTFYSDGPRGYIDYPVMENAR